MNHRIQLRVNLIQLWNRVLHPEYAPLLVPAVRPRVKAIALLQAMLSFWDISDVVFDVEPSIIEILFEFQRQVVMWLKVKTIPLVYSRDFLVEASDIRMCWNRRWL